MIVVFLFLSYVCDESIPDRYKWRFAAQVNLNGLFCVELAGTLAMGVLTPLYWAAQQLTLQVVWNNGWKCRVSWYFSLQPWKRCLDCSWIMPGFVTIYFIWRFKKYCKFQKMVLIFFLRPPQHELFYLFIYLFWRGTQLTFCAEGMIDCAQWWLYEQTSFRQLSEIHRAEGFMGPREAHVWNEKEPPSLSPSAPASPFFTSRRGAHSVWRRC